MKRLVLTTLLAVSMTTQIIQSTNPIYKQHSSSHVLADLEPQSLWHYFGQISAIPRGSYNEAAIAQFIMDEAHHWGCTARKDSVGNVIVSKPASSPMYANAPIVVIQAHLDMVCEKNKNVSHDFTKDPIRFVRKDTMLYADGTTLGADNGIGVAAALALMSAKDVTHGPLEFLFTVVEEAGFDGAKNVTADTISGRILLNIDTEEEGSLYVGCAGSACVIATLPVTRTMLDDSYLCMTMTFDGLRGGHSGVDIDQGRINALKVGAELLSALNASKIDFKLISVDGGNKRNAIARDVEICFAIKKEQATHVQALCTQLSKEVVSKYVGQESKISFLVNVCELTKVCMSRENQDAVIELMQTMPHGVIAVSKFIPNLVETSTNFARVSTKDTCLVFETMQRSLIGAETEAASHATKAVCESHGCVTELTDGSPEWQPNEHSAVLKIAQNTYKRLFNKDIQVKAIHAGLECGAFVRQVPGLDTISFGPTIYDAHSPSEHIDVNTVVPFWTYLTELIGDIAKRK